MRNGVCCPILHRFGSPSTVGCSGPGRTCPGSLPNVDGSGFRPVFPQSTLSRCKRMQIC